MHELGAKAASCFPEVFRKAPATVLRCARTDLLMGSNPGSGLPTPYKPQSYCRSCLGRSHCHATSRNKAVAPQRFKFAALRIDVPPHVRFDGPEPRVIVQRQPQGIAFDGIPPGSVLPCPERLCQLGKRRIWFAADQQTPSAQLPCTAEIPGIVGIVPRGPRHAATPVLLVAVRRRQIDGSTAIAVIRVCRWSVAEIVLRCSERNCPTQFPGLQRIVADRIARQPVLAVIVVARPAVSSYAASPAGRQSASRSNNNTVVRSLPQRLDRYMSSDDPTLKRRPRMSSARTRPRWWRSS